MKAVFPGSFCPPTMGHIDIIERAASLFDKLYVVVGVNSQKTYELPPIDRQNMLKTATAHLKNVEIAIFDGFMTDFCQQVAAKIIIKSARNSVDFQQILDVERLSAPFWGGETVILPANKQYENISSSLIRELIKNQKSIKNLVPHCIEQQILQAFSKK